MLFHPFDLTFVFIVLYASACGMLLPITSFFTPQAEGRNMQGVTIRLYGNMYMNALNKGKIDKVIKSFFIKNQYINKKFKRG